MRLNEHTRVRGKHVVLVPYMACHVPKYHLWMSDAKLRELTASEQLTLEEEYEMQRSWREDSDKLTFIVLCADSYASDGDEIKSMVGDTNLFLRLDDDGGQQQNVAEAEIMIAAAEARGKGYGREAMLLMLKYGQTKLNLDKFEVKIDMDNSVSIHMFESFNFIEVSRSNVFHEITLERPITPEWVAWLDAQVHLKIEDY